MAKVTGLILRHFIPKEVRFGIPQGILNGLSSASFVCHSSLLTAKCFNLVVAHYGFVLQHKSSIFIIVVTVHVVWLQRSFLNSC